MLTKKKSKWNKVTKQCAGPCWPQPPTPTPPRPSEAAADGQAWGRLHPKPGSGKVIQAESKPYLEATLALSTSQKGSGFQRRAPTSNKYFLSVVYCTYKYAVERTVYITDETSRSPKDEGNLEVGGDLKAIYLDLLSPI